MSKLVSLMGQTTVAKPEIRSTKKKQQNKAKCESKMRMKPDYAAVGPVVQIWTQLCVSVIEPLKLPLS